MCCKHCHPSLLPTVDAASSRGSEHAATCQLCMGICWLSSTVVCDSSSFLCMCYLQTKYLFLITVNIISKAALLRYLKGTVASIPLHTYSYIQAMIDALNA